MTDVELALVALANRVQDLENSTLTTPGVGNSNLQEADARTTLKLTLSSLKKVRSMLATAENELESNMSEVKNLKEENDKLRYQIKHLRRSLEAQNANTSPGGQ